MTNIVERLRESQNSGMAQNHAAEAADEIESLRHRVKELEDELLVTNNTCDNTCFSAGDMADAQAKAFRDGVETERETCAKVCEEVVTHHPGYGGQWEGYGQVKTQRDGKECAAAIRDRSNAQDQADGALAPVRVE